MSTSTERIRILLADDHPVVRKGIRTCIAKFEHFEIIGEVADGRDAVVKARELKPDVVLMDIQMPKMDGLEATRLLQQSVPETKVLILSIQSDKATVLQIIRSGARGFVHKDSSPEDLLRAIESVHRGESFFSTDAAQVVLNQYVSESNGRDESRGSRLTPREMEVLTLIAEGFSNKEVSSKLDVSVRTVEAHRERIMRKLNLHSVVGLTRYAIAHGIIRLERVPMD